MKTFFLGKHTFHTITHTSTTVETKYLNVLHRMLIKRAPTHILLAHIHTRITMRNDGEKEKKTEAAVR